MRKGQGGSMDGVEQEVEDEDEDEDEEEAEGVMYCY